MFSKEITDDDRFLELTNEAKLLYFLLSMAGDDDGFVRNAKSIIRLHSLEENALNELVNEKYIIKLGRIYVIRHWRINNYLRRDRYNPSSFSERNEIFEHVETKIYYTKDEIENNPSSMDYIPLGESITESDPKLSAENKTTETEKVNQTDDDLRKEIDAIRSKKGLPPMYG